MLPLPEQRAARKALDRLVLHVAQRKTKPKLAGFPLVHIHGLPGTGKSCLVQEAVAQFTTQEPTAICRVLPARELGELLTSPEEGEATRAELRETDLLAIEDMQYLQARANDELAALVDDALLRRNYVICTSSDGPMALPNLSARLQSRLAAGIVLRVDALTETGRRKLVQQALKAGRLKVEPELAEWLEVRPGECREVLGRVVRLDALQRVLPVPLRLSDVSPHLSQTPQPAGSSIGRIAERVAITMGEEVAKLKSATRQANVAWARQVAMFVARRATGRPLMEIARYFKRRDHTTVLHALAKVEARMAEDPAIRRQVERLLTEAK